MLLEGHAAINELAKESVVHLLDLAKDTLELSIQLMVNNFTVFREIGNFEVDIKTTSKIYKQVFHFFL